MSANEGIGNVVWSPDGKRLAYGKFREGGGKDALEIETRDLANNEETQILTKVPGTFSDLLWLPDGRLIFTSFEESVGLTCNLWVVQMNQASGQRPLILQAPPWSCDECRPTADLRNPY